MGFQQVSCWRHRFYSRPDLILRGRDLRYYFSSPPILNRNAWKVSNFFYSIGSELADGRHVDPLRAKHFFPLKSSNPSTGVGPVGGIFDCRHGIGTNIDCQNSTSARYWREPHTDLGCQRIRFWSLIERAVCQTRFGTSYDYPRNLSLLQCVCQEGLEHYDMRLPLLGAPDSV